MNMIVAPSGRKYYRHQSNQGSVMCWIDENGIERETLILDGKYRSDKLYWGYDEPTTSDYSKVDFYLNIRPFNYDYYRGSVLDPEVLYTDDYINSNLSILDKKSSKENTDVMMTSRELDNISIASFCRDLKVADLSGFDVPNIQTLIRILVDKDTIDSLDQDSPSSSKLKNWWTRCWSSTEHQNGYYAWCLTKYGYIHYKGKSLDNSTIPVLDLK